MDLRRTFRAILPRQRGVILALGGGGARGLAHIGILQILEEESIEVAAIAGTSAGALVGAMWLTLGSADSVIQRWRDFLASDYPDSLPDIRLTPQVSSRDNLLLQYARRLRRGAAIVMALEKSSLVSSPDFEEAIAFLLPEARLERLAVPFAAVATNYTTGEPVALTRGPLRAAIAASSAVPGVVAPYPIGDSSYFDGGLVADVPVLQARALGRRPIVAVAVGEALPPDEPSTVTVPRALLRAGIITHEALRRAVYAGADLVIRPAVGSLHWSEFRRLDEAVAAGKSSAERLRGRLRRLSGRSDRGTDLITSRKLL